MLSRLLFALVLVVAPAVIWGTRGALPSEVASHFNANGLADGTLPRNAYLVVILALATLLPVVVAVTTGLVSHLSRRPKLMRDADYWFAPPRREATQAFLRDHACRLGTLLSALIVGLHLLTVVANRSVPPQLPMPGFFALLASFVALVLAWIAALALRFRTPG